MDLSPLNWEGKGKTMMGHSFNAPSPLHFAAVGNRVASVRDPADRGEVVKWISRDSFVVRWDDGMETECTTFDVEVG